jgi:hypothetical protein
VTPVVTAVVAGVGRSRFSRRSGATEMSLAAQAIAAALRDAKVAPRDVDGVVRFDRDALWEYDLPGVCGITNLGFYNAVPSGPGGAPALLRMAAMAMSPRPRRASCSATARARGVARPDPRRPRSGVARAPAAPERGRRRAHDARASPRGVAEPRRRWCAVRSARRIWKGKSPYVAEPIRRARPGHRRPARARSWSHHRGRSRATSRAAHPRLGAGRALRLARHPSDWLAVSPLERIARRGWAMLATARVRPGDVGVACVNADASPLVPIAVKLYRVATARVNPHGGQLCEAALDGVNDVAEAVRQMRGDAVTPVRGARIALVTGSLLEPTSAVLLGRPS